MCGMPQARGQRPWLRASRSRRSRDFRFIALLCFAVLYLPIATLVVYAFNAGHQVAVWEGFSLRWFESAWHNTAVQEATIRSAFIAIVRRDVCHG